MAVDDNETTAVLPSKRRRGNKLNNEESERMSTVKKTKPSKRRRLGADDKFGGDHKQSIKTVLNSKHSQSQHLSSSKKEASLSSPPQPSTGTTIPNPLHLATKTNITTERIENGNSNFKEIMLLEQLSPTKMVSAKKTTNQSFRARNSNENRFTVNNNNRKTLADTNHADEDNVSKETDNSQDTDNSMFVMIHLLLVVMVCTLVLPLSFSVAELYLTSTAGTALSASVILVVAIATLPACYSFIRKGKGLCISPSSKVEVPTKEFGFSELIPSLERMASDISTSSLSLSVGKLERIYGHVIPPTHVIEKLKRVDATNTQQQREQHKKYLSGITLRDFLMSKDGFHLAMAPAFFGFYAYFGALAAWDDTLSSESFKILETHVSSVSGGSAGAMAAILISAGIPPRKAAATCSAITLDKFADPFGWFALFKGDLFEQIMYDFICKESPCFAGKDNDSNKQNINAKKEINMKNSLIPVAVSTFDIKTLKCKLLSTGDMAKAARASATFPGLFQPVFWKDDNSTKSPPSLLIDGGIKDALGLQGLRSIVSSQKFGAKNADMKKKSSTMIPPKRVINLVVGDFGFDGNPMGPSSISSNILSNDDNTNGHSIDEVLSIRICNTPQCGPHKMANGPRALDASNKAMLASLNLPLYRGIEKGHYELHIDATKFVPAK